MRIYLVGVFLEVLGRGLGCELRGVLRRFYQQEKLLSEGELSSRAYQQPLAEDLDLPWGLCHWRESRLDEAREYLSRARTQNPDSPAVRAALACVLDEQGDTFSALEELRSLYRLLPHQPAVLFSLGMCCERLDRPGEAGKFYRQAVEIDETFQPACERLAAVALRAGDLHHAIQAQDILCRLCPEDTRLRTALGALYFRAREFHQAVDAFEGAIVLEPENWAVRDEEILRLVAEGEVREAIERTHQAIEAQGPFPDLFVQLANLYGLVGDDAPAVKYYHQALDIQPSYLEAMVKLATHHLLFGRWDESAECFGRASELNEDVLLNYLGMAVACGAAGHMEKSAEMFHLAASIEPNSSLLLAQMIRLHWKLAVSGGVLDAIDEHEEQEDPDRRRILRDELDCHALRVEQDSASALARFHFGVLLRVSGRARQATRQFAQAVRRHPTFLSAQVKLGVCLQELGHDRQSARVFYDIFQPSQHVIDEHYRLGILFHQPGRLEEVVERLAEENGASLPAARAVVSLALTNMGLLDRGAATWRELQQAHHVAT
ncbi:MAG: tetratricopeptide repeat protein [Phycisphaerae bacterium]|nr:tetratricopeptide repeat protein [Phycisphaerae bacterium]